MTDWNFKPFTVNEKNQERFDKWIGTITRSHKNGHFVPNPESSFTPLAKPLSDCRVALLSSGGVHLEDQPPFDLMPPDGDWGFREIPGDAAEADLRFSHSHYDHSDADKDPNCMFPLTRLRELAEEGVIGAAAPLHIGMMGFVPAIEKVRDETGPEVARRLIEAGTDAVLMTPG